MKIIAYFEVSYEFYISDDPYSYDGHEVQVFSSLSQLEEYLTRQVPPDEIIIEEADFLNDDWSYLEHIECAVIINDCIKHVNEFVNYVELKWPDLEVYVTNIDRRWTIGGR